MICTSYTVTLLLALFTFGGSQTSNEDWRSRSIYQIVTDRFARSDGSTTYPCNPGLGEYCGGTWKGLASHLDYIQGMGFSAVWISPVTFNIQGPTAGLWSYHGYWQQDLYALNPEFGDVADLRALSDALHSRNMYLMIDVVVGDMASPDSHADVDYTIFNPFNTPKSYHQYCPMDDTGNLTSVEDCWIGDGVISLPDLRTEDEAVAEVIYSWVSSLVQNYTVDGLRIDSVVNLNPGFLPGLSEAAGVYCIGEVVMSNASQACAYSDLLTGFLDYPLYYTLVETFQNSSTTMGALIDQLATISSTCKDTNILGTFSENHDVPRFASYTTDMSLAQNVLTYNILGDGIPVVYYGQEQHLNGSYNPINREALWLTDYDTQAPLYLLVSSLLSLRTHAIATNISYLDDTNRVVYSDDHVIAFRKGFDRNQILFVVTNHGNKSDNLTVSIPNTGLSEGEVVLDVINCSEVTAIKNGELLVTIDHGLPRAFYPMTQPEKSERCLCVSGTDASSDQRNCSDTASGTTSFAAPTLQHLHERWLHLLLLSLATQILAYIV